MTVTNPHESAELARQNAQKVINNSTLSTRSGTSSVITLNMFQDRTTVSQQRMLECYECTSDSKTTNDICITPGVRSGVENLRGKPVFLGLRMTILMINGFSTPKELQRKCAAV